MRADLDDERLDHINVNSDAAQGIWTSQKENPWIL